MPPKYVVKMMATASSASSQNQSGVIKSKSQEMRASGMSDWRAAISAPLTYRIGSSTFHFRSHFLLVTSLITCAIIIITYCMFLTTKGSRYNSRIVVTDGYNSTYPLSKLLLVANGGKKYRIAVVEDPDTESRQGKENLWKSRLRYGYLTIYDNEASLEWDTDDTELSTTLGSGGRGMELSELSVFNGDLITVDDRTGVIYKIKQQKAIPWVILSDGNGAQTKGLKAEWSTVKDGKLWVGGLGKEWTTPQGELANYDPMWVKVVGAEGQVEHKDWTQNYMAVRKAAGVVWPGYMIHEAVCWSPQTKRWTFLPRRIGKERYDDVIDERKGTNIIITADEEFRDIKVSTLGPLLPTHGFSSFKFVPESKDNIIVALKSEEVDGQKATYLTVITLKGTILLPETKIGDAKFEGIEFV